MLILWPRGCFSETGDPLSSLGAPQGGFRAHILVEGCSFMLTHMFTTRINHKTFCCNLFVVPPALYRTIMRLFPIVPFIGSVDLVPPPARHAIIGLAFIALVIEVAAIVIVNVSRSISINISERVK